MSNNPEIKVFSTAGTEADNDKLWKKTVDDTLLTKANVDLANLSPIGQAKFNSKASVSLDNLNTTGELRFTNKASIDLDNLSPAGEAKIVGATGGANVSLSNLDATGEARFTNKSNIDLDNISSAGVAVIQSYAIGGANVDLSNLSATGEARFNSKINITDILGYISGFNATYVTSTTYTINVGSCLSDDDTTFIKLTSGLTKSLSSFAVGNNNGSLDTGTISINTWYYVYAIFNPDTLVTDILISLSSTSPALPSGFTKKRLINTIRTDSSGFIFSFKQIGSGHDIYTGQSSVVFGLTITTTFQNISLIFPPLAKKIEIFPYYLIGSTSVGVIDTVFLDSGAGTHSVEQVANIAGYNGIPFKGSLIIGSPSSTLRIKSGVSTINNFQVYNPGFKFYR